MRLSNKRDCLLCSNSYSTDDENGNPILCCSAHDHEIVDTEQPACEDFN